MFGLAKGSVENWRKYCIQNPGQAYEYSRAYQLAVPNTELMFPYKERPPETIIIEKGCNFFLLTAHFCGLTSYWSCEGHPDGWYMVFGGLMHDCRKLFTNGFNFELELIPHPPFSLCPGNISIHLPRQYCKTYDERDYILSQIAAQWSERILTL